jgi:hypothetical protein
MHAEFGLDDRPFVLYYSLSCKGDLNWFGVNGANEFLFSYKFHIYLV